MTEGLTPLAMIGAGHMGGALITGWRLAGPVAAGDLILRDPAPGAAAIQAATDGARLNGATEELSAARVVILAVKPQVWRAVVAEVLPHIAPDAVILSIMAGVPSQHLREAFPARSIARVMPTTAAAALKGSASIWASDARAREAARRLFEPLGAMADLDDEDLMHVATAASGSAPAYFYALVEALEAAAITAGLPAADARALARGALIGAAALMEQSGRSAEELRRQVTSPGGTTEAALAVLGGDGALGDLMARAVAAAAARSRVLAS
jgi:pyrroline-5-carboxylate reductase